MNQQTNRKGIDLAGTLMLAVIRDILLISTPQDTPHFQQLLGDDSNWGLNVSYAIQPSLGGLAQAFLIGAEFIGTDPWALILGDNVFHGSNLAQQLSRANARSHGASVFTYPVRDPERFGVVARLDTDTHEALLDACNFVETLEKRQRLKMACPEEVGTRLGNLGAAKARSSQRKLVLCPWRSSVSRRLNRAGRLGVTSVVPLNF